MEPRKRPLRPLSIGRPVHTGAPDQPVPPMPDGVPEYPMAPDRDSAPESTGPLTVTVALIVPIDKYVNFAKYLAAGNVRVIKNFDGVVQLTALPDNGEVDFEQFDPPTLTLRKVVPNEPS